LRFKIGSEIVLIYGAEKVDVFETSELAKRTLGSSKINEIHLRGCVFQHFASFSCETLF